MPSDKDIALMAHLMRRAGFGARREELEAHVAQGYEATVEQLLHPGDDDYLDKDIVDRYYIDIDDSRQADSTNAWWLYRMINTRHPLEEKMALFWHGLFATAYEKIENGRAVHAQIDMFRQHSLGNLRTLLLALSQDPAMIIWLDNNTNHKDAPNENYGRELLELFSMGVGNYSEEDVKECTRAFTGWTISNFIPRYPWGAFPLGFEYRPEDHDDSEKAFLGERGRFNGEDIIDIVVRQPATGRFIAGKLYHFFVSDNPAPDEAIDTLAEAYFRSNGDIREVMRELLLSDFFKGARFAKVKAPIELVAGVLRLAQDFQEPQPGLVETVWESKYMGQELLNPPTVEGWHTGKEWIDSGSLVNRVNFAADQVGNLDHPGIQDIVGRIVARGELSPEDLVDSCLDLVGPLEVGDETRQALVDKARQTPPSSLAVETSNLAAKGLGIKSEAPLGGPQARGLGIKSEQLAQRVGQMLQLIVATREFQFA